MLTDANKPATSKTTVKSSRVFAPSLLIEISGGGETRFVVDHRINARYERLSGFVATRQAPADTSSLTGRKRRCWQSARLIRGLEDVTGTSSTDVLSH